VYRIDRHPTMSRHPVTPMQEADVRMHLARQGVRDIGLVDIRAHEQAGGFHAALDDCEVGGDDDSAQRVVLLDVSEKGQLETIGGAIRKRAQRAPLLAVGASSVAQALIEHARLPRQAHDGRVAAANGPVLVLAGSLSPVTARQIDAATAYDRVPLDATRLATDDAYLRQQAGELTERLRNGRHVLAHTSPTARGRSSQPGDLSPRIAPASAALLAMVLHGIRLARVGIAGGDTSSHAVKSLGAWGLEWKGRLDAGVPLLRAHADDPNVEGLELMLKGGQMGRDDLFDVLIRGT
jgi:3-oxoisoapionate kinase